MKILAGLRFCVWFVLLGLAGCLSSAPPAPPVRWFDPLAGMAFEPRSGSSVRVTADTHLGQDIAVRVAPKELAFDTGHRWVLPVDRLLQRAYLYAGRSTGDDLSVHVTAFELRRGAEPAAHIAAFATVPGQPVRRVTVTVPASDSLPALIDAMTEAIATLVATETGQNAPG